MDVDNDIDAQLMQQFLSMGTQDREVLVNEFQKLLGNQLNPAACTFFLDMNNWNLQAAIGSYYDFEQPSSGPVAPILSMTLVKDITIGDGESVRPGVNFTKTWRIKNTGDSHWPPGCSLKFILGHQLGCTERVMVDALLPGSEYDVSVPMNSPRTPGMYQGQWRMSSPTGPLFGDTIWVILQVSEDGLLDITQEMSKCGSDLGSPGPKQMDPDSQPYNPFNSPTRTHTNSGTHSMQTAGPQSDSFLTSSSTVNNPIMATNSMDNTSLSSYVSTAPTEGASRNLTFHPMDEEEMQ